MKLCWCELIQLIFSLFETYPEMQNVFLPFTGMVLDDLKNSKQLRAHALRWVFHFWINEPCASIRKLDHWPQKMDNRCVNVPGKKTAATRSMHLVWYGTGNRPGGGTKPLINDRLVLLTSAEYWEQSITFVSSVDLMKMISFLPAAVQVLFVERSLHYYHHRDLWGQIASPIAFGVARAVSY